jgi:hypothetical protein
MVHVVAIAAMCDDTTTFPHPSVVLLRLTAVVDVSITVNVLVVTGSEKSDDRKKKEMNASHERLPRDSDLDGTSSVNPHFLPLFKKS